MNIRPFEAMNAAGHVTSATEAGGADTLMHTYDTATGELTQVVAEHGTALVFDEEYDYGIWGERTEREDVLHGQTENYSYSAASRLTEAKLATGTVTLAASYDAAGNLQSRSDRGGSVSYTYGVSGHPNRLATLAVSGSDPGIAGGGLSYDAAGRIKSGAGYTVTYDRRGLTASIAKGGHTASLSYAPGGKRYQMTVDGKTTLYLMGGAFRVVQLSGGVVAYRRAIVAGGRMVAQLVTKSNAASGFEYFYHDGLGSPVAFANSAGAGVAPGVAYGPYGRARSAANWATLASGTPLAAYDTRRGYTGGESLAAMGVVVLGARVYIPALGRWLSPDPAGASSSPYVYAGDNPESDTDPTGALDWNSVGKIFEAAAVAFASFYTAGAVEAVYGPVAGGAAGGFVAGFAGSGGNLEDGAIGALGGAAMGYFGDVAFGGEDATAGQLAERATVEGIVGGTLSAVVEHGRGGSFESGFLGAFAAALIGGGIAPRSSSAEVIAARTAAMTVVGGTVAEIGGGSFANGAISAAFQQLFNQALHAMVSDTRASRIIVLRERTNKKDPNLTRYFYQLVNNKGQPIKGSRYKVEEHLKVIIDVGFKIPRPHYVQAVNGIIEDEVGPGYVPRPTANRAVEVYQTFTVKYNGGRAYPLTTELEHIVVIKNGVTRYMTTTVLKR